MAESTAQINLKLKDEATQGLSNISKSFGALKTAIKGLTVVVGAVAGLGTAIGLMAAKGEDLRTMRNLFATLAVNAGSSMDEMVAALSRGAEGLISQTDLMKGSLKLLANTNLPVTAEAMELLAEASKRLGIATGVGAKEAFDRFTAAVTTGRTRSLAYLGVVVDTTDEIEKLAKETNRSVSEISFAEEQTTIYNAVLRETAGALERAGDFSVGFGGQVDQLKTSIVNFKDELFAFTSAFGDAVIKSFKEATGIQINFGTALQFNAETITNFTRDTLVFFIQGLASVSRAWAFVAEGVNLFLGPLSILAGVIVTIGKTLIAALLTPIQGIVTGLELMIGIVGKLSGALGLEGLSGFLKTSSEFIGGFNEDIDGMIEGIDDVSDGLIGMGMESINNIGSAGDSAREFSNTLDDVADALGKIDASDIATSMKGVATNTGIAAKSIKEIADDLPNIAANSKKAADAWITAFKGGIGAATREELVATAQLFASELQTELPELGILSLEDLRKIVETLKTGLGEAADETRAKIEAILPPKFGLVDESAISQGVISSLLSGDVVGAVGSLGDMLEGVAFLGIDVGAILNAITSINKELPKLLFQSIKQLLINLVAELPLLIGNIIPDLIIPIVELIPDIIQGFVRNLPTMITAIIKALPELSKALVIMNIEIIKGIPIFLDAMLSEFFPVWWAEQKPVLIQTLRDAALDVIRQSRQFFQQQLPDIMNTLRFNLSRVFSLAFLDVGAEITAWWNRIFLQEISEGLGGILSDLGLQFDEQIIQPVSEIFSTLVQQMGEAITELAAQFDELIIQPFVEAHIKVFTAFSDAIKSVWDNTFGLLPEIAEQVGDTIAGPLGKVVEQLSGIKIGGDGGAGIGEQIERFTGIRTGFQQGTPFVPRTMLAQVHQGEAIIPAAQNPFGGGGGFGDVNITFGNIVLAPGSMQSQAEELIEIVKRNIRGAGDELRRVVNREG